MPRLAADGLNGSCKSAARALGTLSREGMGQEATLLREGTLYFWAALLVQRYLFNTASFVLCIVGRVKDRHNLLHYSPLLKNTRGRLVLDKWFPLTTSNAYVPLLSSYHGSK